MIRLYWPDTPTSRGMRGQVPAAARSAYREALALTDNQIERDFLEARLRSIRTGLAQRRANRVTVRNNAP